MTKARTNPNPVFFPHHDNRPPGPSLSHSWATICPCCQTKISGAAIDRTSSVRRCRDREACAERRAARTGVRR